MAQPIFLLGIVILASCIISVSVAADENAFSAYWEDHVGHIKAPAWFLKKATPLTSHETADYLKVMEKNQLPAHLPSFCRQANLACSTNAVERKRRDDSGLPSISWNDDKLKYNKETRTAEGGLPYFRESMVEEGRLILIPDLRVPMSYRSFLPRSLASKIPFSFASITSLKKLFGVADNTSMSDYMEMVLKMCDEEPIEGEESKCATSAEDLIDFVAEKFGQQHLRVWSTESMQGSFNNVTIGVVKLVHANLSSPPAVCHSVPFVYEVYYCHVFPKVKVFSVEMLLNHKIVNHAMMACHYDTSAWNPNHLAFKLLGSGPGLIEVCHWINQNGMVWTRTIV